LLLTKSLPKCNWIQLEFYVNNNSECERLGCLSSLPISCRFSRDPNYRCRLTCFLHDSVAFMRDETVPVCTWNRERNLSYASEKHRVLSYTSYVRKNQMGPIDPRRNANAYLSNPYICIFLLYICIFILPQQFNHNCFLLKEKSFRKKLHSCMTFGLSIDFFLFHS